MVVFDIRGDCRFNLSSQIASTLGVGNPVKFGSGPAAVSRALWLIHWTTVWEGVQSGYLDEPEDRPRVIPSPRARVTAVCGIVIPAC